MKIEVEVNLPPASEHLEPEQAEIVRREVEIQVNEQLKKILEDYNGPEHSHYLRAANA
jgi:hypothetical protein